MEISKENFFSHAADVGISEKQSLLLWQSLNTSHVSTLQSPSLVSKWLFYFGAMIILSAMTWLIGIGWNVFEGGGIVLIACIYALIFILLGKKLWDKPNLRIPAGLLITLAVCMTPLAVYGIKKYLGIWPPDDSENILFSHRNTRLAMAFATIIINLIALYFFSFPFLTAPLFFSIWCLIMDGTAFFIGNETVIEKSAWISMFFGIVLICISYMIHLKKKKDYAFWGYLFGLMTFWINLSELFWFRSERYFFVYFLINVLLMLLSLLLKSRIFMVFGSIGAFIYFSYLANEVFANSVLFPFVFSFIGLTVIYLGILYQKYINKIEMKIKQNLPSRLLKFLPVEENHFE